MKIRIAVADDQPLLIKGLEQLLTNNDDILLTGSYTTSAELYKGLGSKRADVLVLDIHMAAQTGIDELVEIVQARHPQIAILVFTNEDAMHSVKHMLQKGVTGYVLKTTSEDVLLDAVRAVHSGRQYLDPVLKERLVQDTLQTKKQNPAIPTLSEREKEVLRYIVMDLTSQQIADKIFVSKRTVDYYRLCLLTKLGVKSAGALVKKGIQLGFI